MRAGTQGMSEGPASLLEAEGQAGRLLSEALLPYGASGWMRFAAAGSWNSGDERLVPYGKNDARVLSIAHDEREAPLALGPDGLEERGLLVSLSDEGDVAACACARVPSDCDKAAGGRRLLGLGIDLASPADFAGRRGERFNHLIFSEGEQRLAHVLAARLGGEACVAHAGVPMAHGEPPVAHGEAQAAAMAMGFAFAFSAKEAAFKACAAPLRRWYEAGGEELLFDVMDFELASETDVRGTLRHAKAEHAMRAMGIRVRVVRGVVCGLACSVATAERRA